MEHFLSNLHHFTHTDVKIILQAVLNRYQSQPPYAFQTALEHVKKTKTHVAKIVTKPPTRIALLSLITAAVCFRTKDKISGSNQQKLVCAEKKAHFNHTSKYNFKQLNVNVCSCHCFLFPKDAALSVYSLI